MTWMARRAMRWLVLLNFLRRPFLRQWIWLIPMGLASLWPLADSQADNGPCPTLDGASIRWIVPHRLGGGYDTLSRLIAPVYAHSLNASIVVHNVSGAGGIVGARTIQSASADGKTIGILNGSGLMAAALSGEAGAPRPAADFTILGRVARSLHIWATAPNSGIETMEDVFRVAAQRPLVFGIRDVGSTSFVSIVLGSELAHIPSAIVPGYGGSRGAALAALRGEVDLVSVNFQSVISTIEAGDLKPLLQISDHPIANHPSLAGVPLLGGSGGIAGQRADARGRNRHEAQQNSTALAGIIGAGRLIIAPPGMDETLASCMEATLMKTLADAALRAAVARSNRSLDVATSKQALAELRQAAERIDSFIPIIRRAIDKLRE